MEVEISRGILSSSHHIHGQIPIILHIPALEYHMCTTNYIHGNRNSIDDRIMIPSGILKRKWSLGAWRLIDALGLPTDRWGWACASSPLLWTCPGRSTGPLRNDQLEICLHIQLPPNYLSLSVHPSISIYLFYLSIYVTIPIVCSIFSILILEEQRESWTPIIPAPHVVRPMSN